MLWLCLAGILPAQSWTQNQPPVLPGARTEGRLAHDMHRWVTVLFGGRNGATPLADTWEWNSGAWTPRVTLVRPQARFGHGMAFDPRRGRTVVFGGEGAGGALLGDTWEWDSTWLLRTTTTAPPARTGAGMVFDSARGTVVLFGGEGAGGVRNDLWEWDGVTWVQRTTANAPAPRRGAAMTYDSRLRKTLLFGGRDGSQAFADTWLYDGNDWTQVTGTGMPPARSDAGIGFDTDCGRAVLFGGTSATGQLRGDAWHWDGATWAQYTNATMPSARTGIAMTYEEQYRVMRTVGGQDASGARNDQWQYANPCFRWMQQLNPATIGTTATFRLLYPPAATNHFSWMLFTNHVDGSYSTPVPGFAVMGNARVDVFGVFAQPAGLLTAAGARDEVVAIPNSPALVGAQFDVQSFDVDLDTLFVWWAFNDIETTVSIPPPVANFTATPTSGPAPLTVTFTNLSQGATSYFWNFGDSTASTLASPPPKVYANPGTYTVTLTVVGPGGSANQSQTITVLGVPVANFQVTPQSGLAPLTVTFTNLSQNATSYAWDFGDGTTSTLQTPPAKTYPAGSYTVTLVASGPGGSNSTSRTVNATSANPFANFSATPSSGPAPLTVSFINLSLNANAYAWDFGDGTTSTLPTPPAKTYAIGVYTVTLTATSPLGSSTMTRTVTALGLPPVASFTATPTAGALPLNVQFTDTSTESPTAWQWDFDNDGTVDSTLQNPQFPYTVAGSYSVRLSATNQYGTGTTVRYGLILAGVTATQLPVMQPIPAGTYLRGGSIGGSLSLPTHQVTLTQPFWMSKHEITQAQFQNLLGTNPSYFQGPGWPNAAVRPVEQVTWVQATAYCAALTAAETLAGNVPPGYQYRLPTEAEWEYCCRAGTTTDYSTGQALTCTDANHNPGTPCVPSGTFVPPGQTAPIGSYAPNAFGLHDMHGNVSEWCYDRWAFAADYPSTPLTDPVGTTGAYRAVRGGSWNTPAAQCASPVRFAFLPDAPIFTPSTYGFRVVLGPILP